MDETREVEVIADEGRYIRGYGSRQKGGKFTLPEKLAKEITRKSDAFKLIRVRRQDTEEVDNAN